MKLGDTELAFIQTVIKLATSTKIDNVVIEPGKVRGMDDKQTIMVYHVDGIPTFEFGSIGINRLTTLSSRIDLSTSFDGTRDIEAVTDKTKDGQQFIRLLTIKNKRSKIEYRCANPTIIKAPKNILDNVAHVFSITQSVVQQLSKGMAAMGSDEVTFTGTDTVVTAELSDVSGDVFSLVVEEWDGDEEDDSVKFTYKYSLKTLLPLLKQPNQEIHITSRGLLKITVDGFDLYIFPRT